MSLRLLALVLVLAIPKAAGTQAKQGETNAQAEILWDAWGVPHIFAKSTEAAGHAFGWAQMQSDGELLLRLLGRARGRGAEYFGKDLVPADQFTRTMGLYETAKKWRGEQGAEFARYLEAFAAGINEYGRQHPEHLTPEARAVLPVDSADIVAHMTRILVGFVAASGGCGSAFPEGYNYMFSLQEVARRTPTPSGGSNGWAIAPSRSASGHAMLLADPHVPWSDRFTWFEAQIVSPGYEVYGGALVGLPIIVIGFNPAIGWTNTTNRIDPCDLYSLVAEGDGYRFDGEKHTFSVEKQIIKARGEDGALTDVPLVVRRALQGPVFEKDGKLFAVRAAGLEVSSMAGALEEIWEMGRAKNLTEFQAALRRMQFPHQNVIYADREGHIFLVFNGHVPVRSKGDAAFWAGVIPGDTSALVWNRIHPYGDLPKVIDPPSGWVQNSNSAPWYMTSPFLDPKAYPEYMSSSSASPGGWPNAREQSGLRILMQGGKMSLEKLVEDKYSTRSQMAERVLDDLIAAALEFGSEDARHAAKVLGGWDRMVDAGSRGAALFEFWAEEMRVGGNLALYAQPFDPKQPLETPRGLKDPHAAVEALDEAAKKLQKIAGRLDVAWGDLYRLRRGKVDLPGNGADRLLGTFRGMEYSAAPDGRFQSEYGDSFIAAVEFGPSLRAKVLVTYGNSSDPKSPHFGDQLVLSAKKQLRDAWLTRDEIEKHLEFRTVFKPNGGITSEPATQRKE